MVLCREVIRKLAENSKWEHAWVYDGRKNLYATEAFLPEESTEEVSQKDSRWSPLWYRLQPLQGSISSALPDQQSHKLWNSQRSVRMILLQVEILDPENKYPRSFLVTLKHGSVVPVNQLLDFIR